jgi:hypothetical protein
MDELHLVPSAYDCDDIPYRLLTLLQMGVLVLATGVAPAFNEQNFTAVTIGYVTLTASAAIAAIATGTRVGLALPWAVVAMSLLVATTVAIRIVANHRRASRYECRQLSGRRPR